MQDFHPISINRLIFELDSLTLNFDNESWENFRHFIKLLDSRDFSTVLVSDSIQGSDWQTYKRLSIIKSSGEHAFNNNSSLSHDDVFWFTERDSLQKELSNAKVKFAGGSSDTVQNGGLQYQNLYDVLQIFHPSKITTADLSVTISKLKQESEKVPLILGIGGPDECGHSFFVGELVDALEDQNLLVSSLDLTNVLGTEFQDYENSDRVKSNSYWRSVEIRNWIIDDVLIPYNQGKKIYIEHAPKFINDYNICDFPFFLAPEMILLVWGTTIFLPEFENLFDISFLLELSDKAATARMFAFDERENFDKAFIQTYKTKEGKYYSNYMKKFNVNERISYKINFDNFNAFRINELS